jgi:hypothetical protein
MTFEVVNVTSNESAMKDVKIEIARMIVDVRRGGQNQIRCQKRERKRYVMSVEEDNIGFDVRRRR